MRTSSVPFSCEARGMILWSSLSFCPGLFKYLEFLTQGLGFDSRCSQSQRPHA